MAEKYKIIRQIIPFANYFIDFKKTLDKTVLKKIYQVFLYIMTTEKVSTKFLKAVEGIKSLYEIRIEEGGNIYRIFCCFDEGQLVVLFNAFQKKTQKTPKNEIEKAERIMKEYFDTKNKKKMLTREEILQRNCTPIEDLIAEDFGQPGTPERDIFDLECDAFILGERLKEERLKAGFTQEQFAQKAGVNKATISKIEHGIADIKLSSLTKIISSIGFSLNLSMTPRITSYA